MTQHCCTFPCAPALRRGNLIPICTGTCAQTEETNSAETTNPKKRVWSVWELVCVWAKGKFVCVGDRAQCWMPLRDRWKGPTHTDWPSPLSGRWGTSVKQQTQARGKEFYRIHKNRNCTPRFISGNNHSAFLIIGKWNAHYVIVFAEMALEQTFDIVCQRLAPFFLQNTLEFKIFR